MFGFIVALVAGFLTPYAEAPLAQPLARALSPQVPLEPGETRLISFMLMMLIAALIARIFWWSNGVWLIVGGILGYFLLRIVAAIRTAIESGRSQR